MYNGKKRKERRMQTSEKTVQRNDRKFQWTGLFLCVCVSLWSREGFGKMSAVTDDDI